MLSKGDKSFHQILIYFLFLLWGKYYQDRFLKLHLSFPILSFLFFLSSPILHFLFVPVLLYPSYLFLSYFVLTIRLFLSYNVLHILFLSYSFLYFISSPILFFLFFPVLFNNFCFISYSVLTLYLSFLYVTVMFCPYISCSSPILSFTVLKSKQKTIS